LFSPTLLKIRTPPLASSLAPVCGRCARALRCQERRAISH